MEASWNQEYRILFVINLFINKKKSPWTHWDKDTLLMTWNDVHFCFSFLILIKSSWNIVQAMLSPLNNKWRGCFHVDLSTGPTKNKNINSDFENYWWKSVSLVAEFIVSVKLLTIHSIYLSSKVGFHILYAYVIRWQCYPIKVSSIFFFILLSSDCRKLQRSDIF